ncbi:MAG: twin-arginine translocation signal domain-containing protein [Anaerolineae bacterium]|nr:twin-arginine translocation signal domain-containing protein [Anaerolineae bacterium]
MTRRSILKAGGAAASVAMLAAGFPRQLIDKLDRSRIIEAGQNGTSSSQLQ